MKQIVILRETERFGAVKIVKSFKTVKEAREFVKEIVSSLTSDETQIDFVLEQVGDPIEFTSDDGLNWQIEIVEIEGL